MNPANQFRCMENVSRFIDACRHFFKLPERSLSDGGKNPCYTWHSNPVNTWLQESSTWDNRRSFRFPAYQ